MPTFSRILRFSSRHRAAPRGFTLIELLVVTAIIAIITAFVLFNQKGFNSSTILRSLSYSIALSVRQAQVYGVSVRESAAGSGDFSNGYGVFFGNSGLVDTSHYLIFADTNDDGQYAAGEELPRFTIGNGKGTDYLIKNYCAHSGSGDQCALGTSPTITSLTIYFRRPNPDACFATSQSPAVCAAGAAPVYDYAYVQIRSFTGTDYRTIKVSSTGQITVCKLNLDSAGVAAC
jgi:prepilin-type N-terminal cleavage/methylation domain-containing protein